MNKKIWIGLASIFLILILVLGIQMLNEENKPAPEQDQNWASQASPYDEDEKGQVTIDNNIENEDTPEIAEDPIESDDQEDPETPEQPEQPETLIEPEAPTESPTETPTTSEQKEPSPLFVTLSVSVETLLDKKDVMNQEKVDLVPEDGWIFPPQKVEFYEGESAFNVLLREMKKNKIHMEYVMTPIYNSNYIEGIGNLYEFDCGELSGWMYAVNDSSPNLGTTNYILKDGDTVQLLYTCNLGRDLGFDVNE